MCGIIATIGNSNLSDDQLNKIKSCIDRRGPDFSSKIEEVSKCGIRLRFYASILHLRGQNLEEQPISDNSGNILLFNGQIYSWSNRELDTKLSDTRHLFYKLQQASSHAEIASALASIDGPLAFIYWRDDLSTLFYGRDIFGRKSLCSFHEGSQLYPSILSSTSLCELEDQTSNKWLEVDSRAFHCIDFSLSITNPTTSRFKHNLSYIYQPTPRCEPEIYTGFDFSINPDPPLAPLNDDLSPPDSFSSDQVESACQKLNEKLLGSVSKRLKYNRNTCLECRKSPKIKLKSSDNPCEHSKVAVAFSGGLDSTMVALALDKIMDGFETIDLVTVAFCQDSPDRESVACAFKELRELCPARRWRLVLGDVTKDELREQRINHIRDLINPCKTVVDDSLGCACWFISRAEGRSLDSIMTEDAFFEVFPKFIPYNTEFDKINDPIISDNVRKKYKSPASMIFVGSAIDEQLGGYSSHKAAWINKGIRGCYEEISFQMRRLPTRNLGRDDRVYSDHGRDLKTPYLDGDLVSFLNELPVGLKMNLGEERHIGPKKILRGSAMLWGLFKTSQQPKRALQFGTRIAKLESSREKGSENCKRLV